MEPNIEFGALLQNPSGTAAPLLSFDHAGKDYTNAGERVRALDDVSLEIGSGRFVAVMGLIFRPPGMCGWMALRPIS
jgi:hypothetical protein